MIFLGELGIPVLVPGELTPLAVGNEVALSPLGLVIACVAFASVDLVASVTLNMAARSGGDFVLRLAFRRFSRHEETPDEVVSGWRRRVGDHDVLMVFGIRLLPGIRISGSLLPGLLRMPMRRFVTGALFASILWASVPLALGFEVRQRVGVVGLPDARDSAVVAIGVAIVFIMGGAWWWVRRAREVTNHRPRDAAWKHHLDNDSNAA
jgi:membrane protein DedA with SNARE-associated domain